LESVNAKFLHSMSARRRVGKIVTYIVLIAIAAIVLMPFFWMLSTALKQETNIYKWPPQWIPHPAVWKNFINAWNAEPFGQYLSNTLFIVILGLSAEVISETIVAYGFARFNFPGHDVLFFLLLATMMLPFHVTVIPTYIIWQRLSLLNTFDPLVLRAWTAWGPFYVFLLRQFFMSIPTELDEAAEIDGCNPLQTFQHIIIPQMKPAILAVIVFAFKGYWNDLLNPLIYLSDMNKYTMNVGMYFFMGGTNESPQWNYLMAMAIIMTLPVLLIFFFSQKYFVEGITFSGIKG